MYSHYLSLLFSASVILTNDEKTTSKKNFSLLVRRITQLDLGRDTCTCTAIAVLSFAILILKSVCSVYYEMIKGFVDSCVEPKMLSIVSTVSSAYFTVYLLPGNFTYSYYLMLPIYIYFGGGKGQRG